MASTYQSGTSAAPQTARAVLSTYASQGLSGYDQPGQLTTALTGTNNDLTFTAVAKNVGSNSVRVGYVVAGASTPLSVSVSGNDITVNVATNGSSAPTSTAAQVAAAIAASAPATALITAANAAGNDGSGVVAAFALTNLAGGSSSSHGRSGSTGPLPTQHPIHDTYA